MNKKYVYLFSEGNSTMRELLGGKGANLAEMTNLRTSGSTGALQLLQKLVTIIIIIMKLYLKKLKIKYMKV